MPPVVWIDEPKEQHIRKPHFHLYGWYTSDHQSDAIQLALNGKDVPLFVYRRPDVEAALPRQFARGFSAFVWLSNYATNDCSRLTLTGYVSGRKFLEKGYVVDG